MAVAATIAVIASVLVLAFQARELARHARIANQVAAVETNRELLRMFGDLHRVFIDYPELRLHFYDQSTSAPNALEQARLSEVSEMFAEGLQVAVETTVRLASYQQYADAWKGYADTVIARSSGLRSVVRDDAAGFSELAVLVDAYDASHPAPPAQSTGGNGDNP